MDNYDGKIEWKNSIPIFKSLIIIKQLGIVVGIPFAIVIAVILITSGINKDSMYGVGLITGTLLLTYLFIKAVYGGKYNAVFIVDNEGIKCSTEEKQKRKNNIINTLTVIAGFFTKKPTISGAGFLADSKSFVSISWKQIKNIKYNDNEFVIVVKGKSMENIALFCNKENYSSVKEVIRGRTND